MEPLPSEISPEDIVISSPEELNPETVAKILEKYPADTIIIAIDDENPLQNVTMPNEPIFIPQTDNITEIVDDLNEKLKEVPYENVVLLTPDDTNKTEVIQTVEKIQEGLKFHFKNQEIIGIELNFY